MTFIHKRRVEFRDTDAAGIVHFSVFFPMMEEAEHAALRHVGLSVMSPDNTEGHLTWPRVSASCDYVAAARFEDLLDICVTVAKIGTTSVTYSFQFKRGDETLANGKITAVCCMWQPGKPLAKQPIPPEIRAAIESL
ncbi:MAG TPA: thioesterase [Planctomycetaceae bacterium]|nr:thioesterase [Planctomycetaceae bacterium]